MSPTLTASEARDAALVLRNYVHLIRSDALFGTRDMLSRYAALADKLEAIAQEHGRE